MADEAIRLRLPLEHFRRDLRRYRSAARGILARAITRTAYEVRDAERVHAGRVFKLRGSSRSFFTGPTAFAVRRADGTTLTATVSPREKTARYLEEHQAGVTIKADKDRLNISGKLAVPVGIKRKSTGLVPESKEPAELLGEGQRGFLTKTALLVRKGRRGRRGRGRQIVEVAYALVRTAKLKKRFKFYTVARRAAERHFPRKVREEFDRRARRGG